ncbi:MAG: atpH [Rickettsiaceae bacterium]|jgi:F-type H+-transporting ATPase subunit delta|nr:atpH [Rickettsiaceae bacterium]
MAINKIVAKKYACAAFNTAKKLNLVDQFLADLEKVSNAFSKSITQELSNPAISKSDLKKIIADLGAKLSLHEKVISFLETIASSRRINEINAIEQNFAQLAKAEKKILEVEVFSAANLDSQNLQNLRAALEKKYAGKKIEIKQLIKKDILGGVQIKIGSTLFDASLKTQLQSLKNQLQSTL